MWQTNQYVLVFVHLSFQLSLNFSIRSSGFCIFNVAFYLSKQVTPSGTKFRLNRKQFGTVRLKDTATSPIVSAVINGFLLPTCVPAYSKNANSLRLALPLPFPLHNCPYPIYEFRTFIYSIIRTRIPFPPLWSF